MPRSRSSSRERKVQASSPRGALKKLVQETKAEIEKKLLAIDGIDEGKIRQRYELDGDAENPGIVQRLEKLKSDLDEFYPKISVRIGDDGSRKGFYVSKLQERMQEFLSEARDDMAHASCAVIDNCHFLVDGYIQNRANSAKQGHEYDPKKQSRDLKVLAELLKLKGGSNKELDVVEGVGDAGMNFSNSSAANLSPRAEGIKQAAQNKNINRSEAHIRKAELDALRLLSDNGFVGGKFQFVADVAAVKAKPVSKPNSRSVSRSASESSLSDLSQSSDEEGLDEFTRIRESIESAEVEFRGKVEALRQLQERNGMNAQMAVDMTFLGVQADALFNIRNSFGDAGVTAQGLAAQRDAVFKSAGVPMARTSHAKMIDNLKRATNMYDQIGGEKGDGVDGMIQDAFSTIVRIGGELSGGIDEPYKRSDAKYVYLPEDRVHKLESESTAAFSTFSNMMQKRAEDRAPAEAREKTGLLKRKMADRGAAQRAQEEKDAADIIKVQALARGRAARKEAAGVKDQAAQDAVAQRAQEEKDAADIIKVQALARGRAARKEAAGVKDQAAQDAAAQRAQEEKDAADIIKVQALARGRAARKEAAGVKDQAAQDAAAQRAQEEKDAADIIKVQALARGRAARKEAAGVKDQAAQDAAAQRAQEEKDAADIIKVQALARGRAARKEAAGVKDQAAQDAAAQRAQEIEAEDAAAEEAAQRAREAVEARKRDGVQAGVRKRRGGLFRATPSVVDEDRDGESFLDDDVESVASDVSSVASSVSSDGSSDTGADLSLGVVVGGVDADLSLGIGGGISGSGLDGLDAARLRAAMDHMALASETKDHVVKLVGREDTVVLRNRIEGEKFTSQAVALDVDYDEFESESGIGAGSLKKIASKFGGEYEKAALKELNHLSDSIDEIREIDRDNVAYNKLWQGKDRAKIPTQGNYPELPLVGNDGSGGPTKNAASISIEGSDIKISALDAGQEGMEQVFFVSPKALKAKGIKLEICCVDGEVTVTPVGRDGKKIEGELDDFTKAALGGFNIDVDYITYKDGKFTSQEFSHKKGNDFDKFEENEVVKDRGVLVGDVDNTPKAPSVPVTSVSAAHLSGKPMVAAASAAVGDDGLGLGDFELDDDASELGASESVDGSERSAFGGKKGGGAVDALKKRRGSVVPDESMSL